MKLVRFCLALTVTLLLLAPGQARADVLLSNFSTLSSQSPNFSGSWGTPVAQYTQNTNFISITSVSSGNPRNDGTFSVAQSFDATGLGFAQVAARIDSGNSSTQFILSITDDNFLTAAATFATTAFNTSGFTTASSTLIAEPGFNPASIIFWQIGGGLPTPTADFRVSFDDAKLVSEIAPIPEATFGGLAWIFGVAGFCLCRRKKN